MPAFCTRWYCFSSAILAGVSADHFCLLSKQQDKTFLQNVFLINPKSSKYLTDKSDEKQYEFLRSLCIILTEFVSTFLKIIFSIIIYIIFLCAQDIKNIFFKSSTLIILKPPFSIFGAHNSLFYLFKSLGIQVFFLPNKSEKQCVELLNNIQLCYKCLHNKDYLW